MQMQLLRCGYILGDDRPLPELIYPATPLAGYEYIQSAVSGVLLHDNSIGEVVSKSQLLAEVLNSIIDELTTFIRIN